MSSVATVPSSSKKDIIERQFFTAIAAAMLGVAIAGFAPSIVFTSRRHAPISVLAAVHGAVFFIWLGIFLLQARLIARRRVRLHTRTGAAAVFVALIMVPLGYATCIEMVRRGIDLSGDLHAENDLATVVLFPLGDLVIFSVLFALAIALRRRPEIHRTLILFANIALIPAPFAHLIGHVPRLAAMPAPIILFPIALFMAAAIGRDLLIQKRLRALTCALSAAMLVSGPLRAVVIGPSAPWHHFLHWLAQ